MVLRTVSFANELLTNAGSSERLYSLGEGPDSSVILLSPLQVAYVMTNLRQKARPPDNVSRVMPNVVTASQTIHARFPPGDVEWRDRLPFTADLPSRVLVAPALLVRHALEMTVKDGLQLTETLESSTTPRHIVVECVEIYQGPSYATDSGTVVRHRCSGAEEELRDATYLRIVCEAPHRPSGDLLIVNVWRSMANDDEAAVPTQLFSAASPEVRLT